MPSSRRYDDQIHRILKLSDVAWPFVGRKRALRHIVDAGDVSSVPNSKALHEISSQAWHITQTFL